MSGNVSDLGNHVVLKEAQFQDKNTEIHAIEITILLTY